MMAGFLKVDTIKFGFVSVLGLIVDIAIAWGVATLIGLSLVLAAVVGFVAGAVFNYLLHEFWTFKVTASRASLLRSASYIAVATLALCTRLGAIAILEGASFFTNSLHGLLVLLIATGLSFVVNYLLSKYLVFKRSPDDTTSGVTH